MMQLRPGTVFAKAYEIVRPISAGGMGIVYEVIHLGTRRRRALKVMLAHIVSDPKMRERFSLEAVVTAEVDSEHITEVFDAGIDPETDCPYLVMELLKGEDLGARLKRGERFSAEETLTLIEQAARALSKTHEVGIVHRDLKPDNLFITRRDDGSIRLKILDFGIAKIVKTNPEGPQATTKTFGTPYYMAREQVTGESALIGPASDLYALAQIAFTLLTGSPYFHDEARDNEGNILAVLIAVGKGPKEPATKRALRRGVELPAAFDAWFQKATSLHPKARFADAPLLVAGLRQALAEPIRYVAGPPTPPNDPVAASSDRMEDSLSEADGGPVVDVLPAGSGGPHETGGPQSITTQVPGLAAKKPSRAGLWIAAVAALGIGIGVVAWRLSGAPTAPATASTGRATEVDPPKSEPAKAEPTAAAAQGAGAPPAAATATVSIASAEPSASVAAAPSSAALPTVGRAPVPSKTAGAGAAKAVGEVWETR
jgi:serine/threonine-protein kinase